MSVSFRKPFLDEISNMFQDGHKIDIRELNKVFPDQYTAQVALQNFKQSISELQDVESQHLPLLFRTNISEVVQEVEVYDDLSFRHLVMRPIGDKISALWSRSYPTIEKYVSDYRLQPCTIL